MTAQVDPGVVRLGVSSCLLGQEVRWDGRHRHAPHLTDVLGDRVRWVPVCPELDIGLGVPREPIHLRTGPGDVRLVGVDSGDEHTTAMRVYAERRIGELEHAGLDGYVLKTRSPSCGPGDVPVHDPAGGAVVGHDQGRFAAVLTEAIPDLPVTGEDRLAAADVRDRFLERVCVRHRWRRWLDDPPTPDRLLTFHTRHEMQVLAHSPDAHARLGALVTRAAERDVGDLTRTYRRILHGALDEPTTRDRHVVVLQHLADISGDTDPALHDAVDGYAGGAIPWAEVAGNLREAAPHASTWLGGQTYLDPLAEVGLTPTSW